MFTKIADIGVCFTTKNEPRSNIPDHPRVQVQIVSYNSGVYVEECLRAVCNQTLRPERTLVIDNASSDDTVEIVQGFSDVEVVYSSWNMGYATGHNIGFARALTDGMDYVLTVNPDVRLNPNYLELLVRSIETKTCAAGATGLLLRPLAESHNPLIVDTTGLEPGPLFHVLDRGAGEVYDSNDWSSGDVWGICGAAALFKTQFLRDLAKLGYILDDTFFVYKDDVDVAWRASLLGWRFRFNAEAQGVHARGWKKGARVESATMAHSYANQISILLTYARTLSLSTFLAVFAEMVRFIQLTIVDFTAARLAARLIASNLEHTLTKRRALKVLQSMNADCGGKTLDR